MSRILDRLQRLVAFIGICAAVCGFVLFIPPGARRYLSGFAYSWAAVVGGVVVASLAHPILRRLPLFVAIPAVAAGYFVLIATFCYWGGAIALTSPDLPVGDWLTPHHWPDWLTHKCHESLTCGTIAGVVLIILMAVDALMQRALPVEERDFAYYPRIGGLMNSFSLLQGRLVLLIGFLVVLAIYADFAVAQWKAHGRISASQTPFVASAVGWVVLWIADCVSRPRSTTLWVAILFLFIALGLMPAVQDAVE
jgi:hypothetical protein